jgi:hypothetical protein
MTSTDLSVFSPPKTWIKPGYNYSPLSFIIVSSDSHVISEKILRSNDGIPNLPKSIVENSLKLRFIR